MDSQLAENFDSEAVAIHQQWPWKDESGQTLADSILKETSKNWSQDNWEAYLKWSETPLSESLMAQGSFIEMADSSQAKIFENIEQCTPISLKNKVANFLELLTPRQREILRMIFWENKSEREIAAHLKISRSTVKQLKKRVLRSKSTALRLTDAISSDDCRAIQPDVICSDLT